MRKGRWSQSCPDMAIGLFLLLEQRMHHPPTSSKLAYSRKAVLPLDMRLLIVLEDCKSKEGALKTDRMTTIEQGAVKNFFFRNLRFRVAKHM
jgi:hypothetical protein